MVPGSEEDIKLETHLHYKCVLRPNVEKTMTTQAKHHEDERVTSVWHYQGRQCGSGVPGELNPSVGRKF